MKLSFTPEGQDVIQRDLDRLKKWGHGNIRYQHRLGLERWRAALLRRAWGE